MFNLLKIYQIVSTRISSEMAVAFWIPINHCCSSLPPFGIVSSLYFSEFSKYVVAPYLSFNSLIVYSVRYLIKHSLDISVSLLMRIFLPTFFLTNAVSLSISEFLNIFKRLPIWFLFLNYFEIFFLKMPKLLVLSKLIYKRNLKQRFAFWKKISSFYYSVEEINLIF